MGTLGSSLARSTDLGSRFGIDAAALVRPAIGGRACGVGDRRRCPVANLTARSGEYLVLCCARPVFGGPLGAASPARVLLAGHRCLAGAAQAWEVAFTHDLALLRGTVGMQTPCLAWIPSRRPSRAQMPVTASDGSIGGRPFGRWRGNPPVRSPLGVSPDGSLREVAFARAVKCPGRPF